MASFLWTERAEFGPGARRGAAMAYDSVRGVTVMFGGKSRHGNFSGRYVGVGRQSVGAGLGYGADGARLCGDGLRDG